MRLIAAVLAAVSIDQRLFAEVGGLEASRESLRVGAEHRVRRPHDEEDGSEVRAGAASVNDVDGVLGLGLVDRGKAGHEAHDLRRINSEVAVDEGALHLLVHGFDEGAVFGQSEGSLVAVEFDKLLVDFSESFQHADRVGDLLRLALGRLNAIVQLTPCNFGKAGAHGRDVLHRASGFDEGNVVEHLIRFREDLDDSGIDLSVGRHPAGQIVESRIESAHSLFLLFSDQIRIWVEFRQALGRSTTCDALVLSHLLSNAIEHADHFRVVPESRYLQKLGELGG